MRPGVFEVRARPFWLTSPLISDDLPTLERPAKATSSGPSGGRNFIDGTPRMKIHGRWKIGLSLIGVFSAIVSSCQGFKRMASRFWAAKSSKHAVHAMGGMARPVVFSRLWRRNSAVR